jgi:hypothetical protein
MTAKIQMPEMPEYGKGLDKVMISTMTYQGFDYRFVNRLIHTLFNPPEGIGFGYNILNTSLIDVGYSICVTNFLENSDKDFLLSWEYDVLLNPWDDPDYQFGPDIKRIVESCKEKQSLVCAPYIIRNIAKTICGASLNKAEEITCGPDGGMTELMWAPLGYTCMSRAFLQKMADSMEKVQYDEKTELYPLFMPYIWESPEGNMVYLTLDRAFSQRARDLGFKLWMDSRIHLGHISSQVMTTAD